MSNLRLRISMSFDGYTSGPNQSVKDPLGVRGEELHEWVVSLRVWRTAHGQTGGVDNESSRVVEDEVANIGATIMGRHMFGGHPGGWDAKAPWRGWWGKNPPFHHPVFVLTHHERAPLTMEGNTTATAALRAAAHARAWARIGCPQGELLSPRAGMLDDRLGMLRTRKHSEVVHS